jgi:hypothetical protein
LSRDAMNPATLVMARAQTASPRRAVCCDISPPEGDHLPWLVIDD